MNTADHTVETNDKSWKVKRMIFKKSLGRVSKSRDNNGVLYDESAAPPRLYLAPKVIDDEFVQNKWPEDENVKSLQQRDASVNYLASPASPDRTASTDSGTTDASSLGSNKQNKKTSDQRNTLLPSNDGSSRGASSLYRSLLNRKRQSKKIGGEGESSKLKKNEKANDIHFDSSKMKPIKLVPPPPPLPLRTSYIKKGSSRDDSTTGSMNLSSVLRDLQIQIDDTDAIYSRHVMEEVKMNPPPRIKKKLPPINTHISNINDSTKKFKPVNAITVPERLSNKQNHRSIDIQYRVNETKNSNAHHHNASHSLIEQTTISLVSPDDSQVALNSDIPKIIHTWSRFNDTSLYDDRALVKTKSYCAKQNCNEDQLNGSSSFDVQPTSIHETRSTSMEAKTYLKDEVFEETDNFFQAEEMDDQSLSSSEDHSFVTTRTQSIAEAPHPSKAPSKYGNAIVKLFSCGSMSFEDPSSNLSHSAPRTQNSVEDIDVIQKEESLSAQPIERSYNPASDDVSEDSSVASSFINDTFSDDSDDEEKEFEEHTVADISIGDRTVESIRRNQSCLRKYAHRHNIGSFLDSDEVDSLYSITDASLESIEKHKARLKELAEEIGIDNIHDDSDSILTTTSNSHVSVADKKATRRARGAIFEWVDSLCTGPK